MLHTVYYEPQGQRFEPREQQENDLAQAHLHLSLHFRPNLGGRLRRTSRSIIARVTTIFAAFMGALSLALGPVWTQAQGTQTPPALEALFGQAGHIVIAGALLGLGAILLGGIPLVVSAWRTSPRSRSLLFIPIFVSLSIIACAVLAVLMMALGFSRPPLILPVILCYGGAIVSTIAIIRAIRQARIADMWLRLANHLSWLVVVGMVLMLAGVVLWGIALALVAGWLAVLGSWLPLASGISLAVMVALWAAIFRVQPSASQPRPHDASPSEVGSREIHHTVEEL